jgi:hypothetical protein
MAKHKLFRVPGTWEAVAAANGNPGGITPGAEIGGVWDIIPGWTALRHSTNHPNFWGPRLPTTINV